MKVEVMEDIHNRILFILISSCLTAPGISQGKGCVNFIILRLGSPQNLIWVLHKDIHIFKAKERTFFAYS